MSYFHLLVFFSHFFKKNYSFILSLYNYFKKKFKNKSNLSKSNKILRDIIIKRKIYDNQVTIKK